MRYLFHSAAVLALGVAAAFAADPAAAQTAAGTQADTTDGSGAVVVTVRKTAESQRDIPATVTAVTAAQLTATGPVTGTGDLLRTVPGVRFNDLQAPNLSEISIRGSGTERATGADSGVGLFVNGAYVGSSTLGGRNFRNLDFFDLDRVEVLEGAQGALYGRNSEFGTVNIVSAKPKFENSGYVDDSFTGGLDQNRLTGVANYKVSDDVAVRIGGETIGQTKGFYLNPDNGQYYDRTDGWLARGQVRYKHGPLDVDLLVDGQDLQLPAFVSGFAIAPGTLATVPLGFTNDRFNVPSNGRNDTRQKVFRSQLIASLDLGWATLASTTMISNFDSLQYYGSSIDLGIETQLQSQGEIGAYPLSQVHTGVNDHTLYEDLHLSGNALGGALDWLGGIEFLSQHDGYVLSSATSPCTLTAKSSICGGTPDNHVCYQLLPTDTACPATYPAGFGSVSFTQQRYTSEAAYGSLRYRWHNFTFSGELRYTDDLKSAGQTVTALYTGTVTGTPTNYRFKADKTSYTATVSYRLPTTWDDLVYVKTGTGYRAGGVNNGLYSAAAPVPFSPTYSDESTVSYEAGIKGNLGRNIYATLDAYNSSTQNAITSINDGCTVLNACKKAATLFNINGGTVHAHGVELAVDGRFHLVGGRLNWSLNGANQHAHFVSANGTYAGLPIVGSPVAQIPDWTSSASVDYLHALTGNVDGFFHVTYSHQSGGGQDTVTSAAPFIPLATITNVSLRTGIRFQKLEAAVFVQNATDETLRLLTLQSGGVTTAYRYNQPRTVGVDLSYHW